MTDTQPLRSVLLSVSALILSFALLLAGNGLQFVAIGLRAATEGFSVQSMGWVSACYFLGFGVGSVLCPALVRSAGHIRAFAAFGSIISGVALAHPLFPNEFAWAFFRLLTGFSFAGLYMVVESWLNARASNELRGRLLAIYGTAVFAGYSLGPLLAQLASSDGYEVFVIASIMVSFALVPVTLTRASAPVNEPEEASEEEPFGLRRLYRETPLGIIGLGLISACQGAFLGLTASFGDLLGLEDKWVTYLMTGAMVAGLLAQFPLGWLSDRFDRRLVIGGFSLLGAAATGFFAFFIWASGVPDPLLLVVFSAVTGMMIFPLYTVLLAYINDRLPVSSLVRAAAALILVYSIGSTAGSPAASYAMEAFGASGFYLFIATMLGGVTLFTLYRMARRPGLETEGESAPAYAVATPGTVPLPEDYEEPGEPVEEIAIAEGGEPPAPAPAQ
jgi:MFS family permease